MATLDYSITFACYNQAAYTRACVESMVRHGMDLGRVVAVDNGSSDETRDYLSSLPLGGRVFNKVNLGCGVAWNQGALALQTEWTIVMNNDLLVSANWIEGLLGAAQSHGLRIVSPALIEGSDDYPVDAFLSEAATKMKEVLRVGVPHAQADPRARKKCLDPEAQVLRDHEDHDDDDDDGKNAKADIKSWHVRRPFVLMACFTLRQADQ